MDSGLDLRALERLVGGGRYGPRGPSSGLPRGSFLIELPSRVLQPNVFACDRTPELVLTVRQVGYRFAEDAA
jgi:hypothetical protein